MKKLWGSVGKRGLAFLLSVTIVVTLIPNLGGIAHAEDEPLQTQSEQQADQSKDAEQSDAAVALDEDQGEVEQPSQDVITEDDSSQEDVSPQPDEGEDSGSPAVTEEKSESDDSPGSSAAPSEKKEKDQTKDEQKTEYPATSFERTADGMTVCISAPEGALPEGATVKVKKASKDAIEDAVKDAYNEDTKVIKAVDITFYDKGGNEIEPKQNVSVSFVSDAFGDLNKPKVAHVNEDGTVERVSGSKVDMDKNKATFTSDEFSVYIIIDEEGTQTYRRTYKFINEVGEDGSDPGKYEFLNKAGELVDNQIIKNGDELEEVGSPYVTGKSFLGWYLVTKNGDNYTYTDTKVEFGEAITGITADETVYVAPKYEAVYYVTFHETARGTTSADDVIQTKKIVVTSGEAAGKVLISDVLAPQPDESHLFYGWYVEDETTPHNVYDENNQLKTTYIEGVDKDIDLYPNFVEAYWLRYVAGEVGSGAKYVESQFVLAEDVLTKLPVTTRKGYDFDGWYTGSQDDQGKITYGDQVTDANGNVINPASGLVLTEETTLYAHWTAHTDATYNVVFWKQKVSDRKDAPASEKTYDYWETVTRHGTTDQEVAATDADKTRSETGFHFARTVQNSETIRANGGTVINVYYDRNLMAVNFYYQNGHQPQGAQTAYTYTATTSNDGTLYGLLPDGTYVLLTRGEDHPTTRVYYTYNTGGWFSSDTEYYGTFYTKRGNGNNARYTATQYNGNNLPPEGDNTTYYAAVADWFGSTDYYKLTKHNETTNNYGWTYEKDGQQVPYTGTRYTRSTNNTYPYMVTYTGLYGQEFDKAWPASQNWNEQSNGNGTRQTFLTGFTNSATPYNLYDQGSAGTSYPIYHYKQALDGKYYETAGNRFTAYGNGGSFHFSDKFPGFKVNSYNTGNNGYSANGGSNTNMSNTPSTYPLHVYHTRNKYKIDYVVDGEVKKTAQNIYYESPLKPAETDDPATPIDETKVTDYSTFYPAPEKEHYTFTGWYADEKCSSKFNFGGKMPDANVVVYAGYTPDRYQVIVDPDGGVIAPGSGAATYFNVDYNETVSEYPIQRPYIEDPIGTYKYVYIRGEDDPDGNIRVRTATYEIAEAGYTGTKYRPIDPANDPTYSLVGWYVVDENDQTTSTPYDFDSPVTENIKIRAVWRLGGKYQVQYNATDKNGVSGAFTQADPEANYADRAEIIIQEAPKSIVPANYVFDGWEVVDQNGDTLDDNGGKYYQPGDELILKAAAWSHNKVIHLQAHYTKAENSDIPVPVTKLIFDANGGSLTEAPKIEDKNGNQSAPSVAGNKATYSNLPINQDYALSLINENVTRDGYELIGWNTSKTAANAGTVEFKLGDTIGVDELPDKSNTLYAVWQSKLKITVKDKTTAYNGAEQSGNTITTVTGTSAATISTDEYTVEGLVEGDVLTVTGYTPAKGTDIGTYNNGSFDSATITITRNGADVTSLYKIQTKEGKLKIDPKKVTITANDASKEYDGTALTESGFTVSGLATGDTHTFTVAMTEGSTITNVGTEPNVIATVDGTKVTTGTPKEVGNYIVTTANGTLTITKDDAEIVIGSASHNWTYDSKTHKDETYTVKYGDVTVDPDSTGKVFTLSNGDVITITSTAEGVTDVADNESNNNTYTYTIKHGSTDTSGNYENIVTNVGTLTIDPKAVTITANDASKTYDGTPLTEIGFKVSDLEEGDSHTFTVVMTEDSTITDFGTQPNVIATVDGVKVKTGEAKAIGNYMVTTANGTLKIDKAPASELGLEATGYTGVYDAASHAASASATVTEGTTIKYSTDGENWSEDAPSMTNVLRDDNGDVIGKTVYVKAENANYETATAEATLKILPRPVTFKGKSESKVYTGSLITINALEVTPQSDIAGLISGQTHNVTFSASGTDAGEYDGTITKKSDVVIKAGNTDVTGNYDITVENGKLTITPITDEVTVTVDGNTKETKYNSSLQIVEGFTYSADMGGSEIASDQFEVSLKEGKTAEASGINVGTYQMGLDEDSLTVTAKNYSNIKVVVNDGKLDITKRILDITSASAEKVYDGTELTDGGYEIAEVDGLAEGEYAVVDVTGTRTNAGTSPNEFTVEVYKEVKRFYAADDDAGTQRTTDNYDIKKQEGTLTVTKATLTVTTLSAEKEYDGKPLTAEGVLDGLVDGETVTFTTTGSQTTVGSSTNTYTLEWNGTAQEENYEVVEQLGTLKVAEAQKPHDDPDDGKDKEKGKKKSQDPNDPTPSDDDSSKAQKPANSAQTGDQADIFIFMMLMLTAMAVMIIVVVADRRRRREE